VAVRVLPEAVVPLLARALGPILAGRDDRRRAAVTANLRRVCGPGTSEAELRRVVIGAFASYTQYWLESFRLPGSSFERLDAGMSWSGVGHLEDAAREGRGAILALPHLGCWEWAGAWLCAVGYPITVVVEALEPREVFDWFVTLRSGLGMTVVPLGPAAGRRMLSDLNGGRVVCLLSDRDIGGGGIEVDFFGERTTLPAGPATLALRTGAVLLPTTAYFEGTRHRGIVGAPVDVSRRSGLRADVTRITQDLAHRFEDLIRVAPDQWHVFQPNWPTDPGYRH
jgi:KDO2-lipid IV(A) lauroyltransferase